MWHMLSKGGLACLVYLHSNLKVKVAKMGLSASQGRLLLLTARKNDLELRAQQISQRRLVLSQQLESISNDYENATSNRVMTIVTRGQDAAGTSTTKDYNLSYAALTSGLAKTSGSDAGKAVQNGYGIVANDASASFLDGGFNVVGMYRLVDADGAIVVSNKNEIPGANDKSGEYKLQEGGDGKYTLMQRNSDNKYITVGRYTVDEALQGGGTGVTAEANYLQDCLRNGLYLIESGTQNTSGDGVMWKKTSYEALSSIADTYYDADDAAAKAKYDRLQNQVQNQDKKLEMELDNIETQRSAVTTEVDSVKKVISDNVQKTFKTFNA